MATPQQTTLPGPSPLGRILGYILMLLAVSVAYLAIFPPTAVPLVRPEHRLLWFGVALALLTWVPGLLFVLSPRLLGGPVGWYLRALTTQSQRGARAEGL